ncbi:MAG: hypothetical protein VB934_00950 [Polyangiaceae bacterium]
MAAKRSGGAARRTATASNKKTATKKATSRTTKTSAKRGAKAKTRGRAKPTRHKTPLKSGVVPDSDLPPDSEAPQSSRAAGAIASAWAMKARGRRLNTILRALPEEQLLGLAKRVGIRVDEKKRIDAPAQVARALVRLPDVREPQRLPGASVELLRRIAEARGALTVATLPNGLEMLVRRGIVFARHVGEGIELILPTALLIQLASWESEDPRSLRALLSDAPFETAGAIANHYLGRTAAPPIALSLEPAWEILGDADRLREELDQIAHQERRLLDQLEQVGGEVDTQELMDLEREPMRVRGAYGVAAGRRGAAFSLEKRGFLFPLHPNRYVVPTEVAVLIGAERSARRKERRAAIRGAVVAEDHLPRRARFSTAPGTWAIALALAFKDSGVEIRGGLGTPRSLVNRLAQRFGRETETTALIVCLSRAVGLWEQEGLTRAAPPGGLTTEELSRQLFDAWRRGGAWDEARPDAELMRVAKEQRDTSPVGVVRDMVVDALQDLGEGQWVPYNSLYDYLKNDPRTGSITRLFARWSERVGIDSQEPMAVARRVLLESLPALGVVDLGGADVNAASGSGELASLALRLTARGRRYVSESKGGPSIQEPSGFSEPFELTIGTVAIVADVLDLGACSDIGGLQPTLVMDLSRAAISRGLASGLDADTMRQRIEAIAPVSAELSAALEDVGTIVGQASLTPAGGFLWVEDHDVRELLRTRAPAADLFVDPSPPGGLLTLPGVEGDRLKRRCRALGVDVEVEEGQTRARRHSSAPPPMRSATKLRTSSASNREAGGRRVSWRPMGNGKS